MAIAARAVQAWATSTSTTATATIPSGTTTGDMMILFVGIKPYSGTYSINNGWTLLGEFADGTVANGSGVGSVDIAVFYKEHTGSESNPTITFGRTAAPAGYSIRSYSKAAGETWATPVHAFDAAAAATSHSEVVASSPSITAGDMVLGFYFYRDDTTQTVPTFTTPSVTYGTVAEYPSTALTTTTSNDIAADACHRLASSGTSSGNTTMTHTTSTSETGAYALVRLRVSSATNVSVECATGTGSAENPDVNPGMVNVECATGDASSMGDPQAGAFNYAYPESATGSGEALAPSIVTGSNVPVECATATGSANLPKFTTTLFLRTNDSSTLRPFGGYQDASTSADGGGWSGFSLLDTGESAGKFLLDGSSGCIRGAHSRALRETAGAAQTAVRSAGRTLSVGPKYSPGINIGLTGTQPVAATYQWVSQPLAEDAIIDGQITFNIWAYESNALGNATLRCVIGAVSPNGNYRQIINANYGTELGTSYAAINWNATPSSAVPLSRGDVLVLGLYADDADSVTMAASGSVYASYNAASSTGYSWVTFSDALQFDETSEPTGTSISLSPRQYLQESLITWPLSTVWYQKEYYFALLPDQKNDADAVSWAIAPYLLSDSKMWVSSPLHAGCIAGVFKATIYLDNETASDGNVTLGLAVGVIGSNGLPKNTLSNSKVPNPSGWGAGTGEYASTAGWQTVTFLGHMNADLAEGDSLVFVLTQVAHTQTDYSATTSNALSVRVRGDSFITLPNEVMSADGDERVMGADSSVPVQLASGGSLDSSGAFVPTNASGSYSSLRTPESDRELAYSASTVGLIPISGHPNSNVETAYGPGSQPSYSRGMPLTYLNGNWVSQQYGSPYGYGYLPDVTGSSWTTVTIDTNATISGEMCYLNGYYVVSVSSGASGLGYAYATSLAGPWTHVATAAFCGSNSFGRSIAWDGTNYWAIGREGTNNTVRLWSATDIAGPWTAHDVLRWDVSAANTYDNSPVGDDSSTFLRYSNDRLVMFHQSGLAYSSTPSVRSSWTIMRQDWGHPIPIQIPGTDQWLVATTPYTNSNNPYGAYLLTYLPDLTDMRTWRPWTDARGGTSGTPYPWGLRYVGWAAHGEVRVRGLLWSLTSNLSLTYRGVGTAYPPLVQVSPSTRVRVSCAEGSGIANEIAPTLSPWADVPAQCARGYAQGTNVTPTGGVKTDVAVPTAYGDGSSTISYFGQSTSVRSSTVTDRTGLMGHSITTDGVWDMIRVIGINANTYGRAYQHAIDDAFVLRRTSILSDQSDAWSGWGNLPRNGVPLNGRWSEWLEGSPHFDPTFGWMAYVGASGIASGVWGPVDPFDPTTEWMLRFTVGSNGQQHSDWVSGYTEDGTYCVSFTATGYVWTSTDGYMWTRSDRIGSFTKMVLRHGNGVWLATEVGELWAATDPRGPWTQVSGAPYFMDGYSLVSWDGISRNSILIYSEKYDLWVAFVNSFNDIAWTSTPTFGESWQVAVGVNPDAGGQYGALMVHDRTLFVGGGYGGTSSYIKYTDLLNIGTLVEMPEFTNLDSETTIGNGWSNQTSQYPTSYGLTGDGRAWFSNTYHMIETRLAQRSIHNVSTWTVQCATGQTTETSLWRTDVPVQCATGGAGFASSSAVFHTVQADYPRTESVVYGNGYYVACWTTDFSTSSRKFKVGYATSPGGPYTATYLSTATNSSTYARTDIHSNMAFSGGWFMFAFYDWRANSTARGPKYRVLACQDPTNNSWQEMSIPGHVSTTELKFPPSYHNGSFLYADVTGLWTAPTPLGPWACNDTISFPTTGRLSPEQVNTYFNASAPHTWVSGDYVYMVIWIQNGISRNPRIVRAKDPAGAWESCGFNLIPEYPTEPWAPLQSDSSIDDNWASVLTVSTQPLLASRQTSDAFDLNARVVPHGGGSNEALRSTFVKQGTVHNEWSYTYRSQDGVVVGVYGSHSGNSGGHIAVSPISADAVMSDATLVLDGGNYPGLDMHPSLGAVLAPAGYGFWWIPTRNGVAYPPTIVSNSTVATFASAACATGSGVAYDASFNSITGALAENVTTTSAATAVKTIDVVQVTGEAYDGPSVEYDGGAVTYDGVETSGHQTAVTIVGTLTTPSGVTGALAETVTTSGTLAAVKSISGALQITATSIASPTRVVNATAALQVTDATSTTLTTVKSLSGSCPGAVTLTGTLGATTKTVTGTLTETVSRTGTLTAAKTTSSSLQETVTSTSALTAVKTISGSLPVSVSVSNVVDKAAHSVTGTLPVTISTVGTVTKNAISISGALTVAASTTSLLLETNDFAGIAQQETVTASGSLTRSATITGAVTETVSRTAALSFTSATVGTRQSTVTITGTLDVVKAITGSLPVTATTTSALTTTKSVTGSLVENFTSLAGTFTRTAAVTGALQETVATAGAFARSADTSSVLPETVTTAGTLSAVKTISGSLTVTESATADTQRSYSTAGSLPITATTTSALTTVKTVTGSLTETASLAGVLDTAKPVTGALVETVTPAGTFGATTKTSSSTGSVVVSSTSALTAVKSISGSLAVTTGLAGVVDKTTISTDGSRAETVSASATLAAVKSITGALQVTAASTYLLLETNDFATLPLTETVTTTGTFTRSASLSGSLQETVSTTGALAYTRDTSGALSETVSSTATLARVASISGELAITATAAGTLTKSASIAGSLTETTTSIAALDRTASLFGSLPITTSALGTLTRSASISGSLVETATLLGALAYTRSTAGELQITEVSTAALGRIASVAGILTETVSSSGTHAYTRDTAGALNETVTTLSTLSASKSVAGTLTETVTVSGVLTKGAIDNAGAVTETVTSTATLSAVKSISGELQVNVTRSVQLLEDNDTAATPITATVSTSGTFTKVATITAEITETVTGSASLAYTRDTSGALQETVAATAALDKSASLAGVVTETVTSAGSLTRSASLSGERAETISITAQLGRVASISGELVVAAASSADLTRTAAVSGQLPVTVTTSGTLNKATISIDGALAVGVTSSGTLARVASTSGALTETVTGAYLLLEDNDFAGIGLTETVTTSGTLARVASTSGELVETVTTSGNLAYTHSISGSLQVTTNSTGTLARVAEIAGSLAETASSAAALQRSATITGALTETVSTSGTADKALSTSAALPVTETATAELARTAAIDGSLVETATIAGSASKDETNVSGSLPINVAVVGDVARVASISGELTVNTATSMQLLEGNDAAATPLTETVTTTGTFDRTASTSGELAETITTLGALAFTRGTDAAATGTVTVTATFQKIAAIVGELAETATTSGTLTRSADVAGQLAENVTIVGDVTKNTIDVTGELAVDAVATADLARTATISGQAQSVVTTSTQLLEGGDAAAAVAATVTTASTLARSANVSGSLAEDVATSSSLSRMVSIDGALAVAASIDSAATKAALDISGSLVLTATTSATPVRVVAITGSLTETASTASLLLDTNDLVGALRETVSTSATVARIVSISGELQAGVASITGSGRSIDTAAEIQVTVASESVATRVVDVAAALSVTFSTAVTLARTASLSGALSATVTPSTVAGKLHDVAAQIQVNVSTFGSLDITDVNGTNGFLDVMVTTLAELETAHQNFIGWGIRM